MSKTAFAPAGSGIHEVFCGLEGDGMIAGRPEQPLQGPPYGLVIIYHVNRERFLRHITSASPDKTPRSMDSNVLSEEKDPSGAMMRTLWEWKGEKYWTLDQWGASSFLSCCVHRG